MATIDLGKIKFNWKGAYASSTAYTVDDVVESAGSSYVCILASTGNTPPNATYWELMADKGTDTSIATTQGDVLYHNGTSLARLGAGTSGQVLQTGGTGANPSWETVSSDYVKLVETTTTGSESQITIDGYFSSTYRNYKCFLSNVNMNSDPGGYMNFRVRVSNSEITSTYYASEDGVYGDSGASTYWKDRRWNDNANNFGGWNLPTTGHSGATATTSYELTIYNPLDTAQYKTITSSFGGWERGMTYTYTGNNVIVVNQTSALSGIQFKNNAGGTFRSGVKATLYGIK